MSSSAPLRCRTIEDVNLPAPATKLIITQHLEASRDSPYWAWIIVGAFYDSDNNVVWSTEIFAGHLDVEIDSDEETGDGESLSASSEVGLSDSEGTDSASGKLGASCTWHVDHSLPELVYIMPPQFPPSSSLFLMAVQTSTLPAQKTISTLTCPIDTETKLLLLLLAKFARSTLTGTRVRHTSSPLSTRTPPRPTLLLPPGLGTRLAKGQCLDSGKPRSIQTFAVGFTPGSPCADDRPRSPCPAAGTPLPDAMRLVLALPLPPSVPPCRPRDSHTSLTMGDLLHLTLNTTVM